MLTLAAVVAAVPAGGCASGWDTLTSRRFRDKPWATTWGTDDPMTVLRTSPVGDERARAMARLAEPGAGHPDHDEAVQLLTQAATADPSPWVRLAAVDALGRFKDPRAGEALVAAYAAAPGKPAGKSDPAPAGLMTTAGGRTLTPASGPGDLRGPQGFPADQVAGLRVRILDAVARHAQPAGVDLLARAADGRDLPADDDPVSWDAVRQAAVRNLGTVKQPRAAEALARVLAAESGRDVAVATLAHDGLRAITGKDLPADPKEWQAVVQAGAVGVDAPR